MQLKAKPNSMTPNPLLLLTVVMACALPMACASNKADRLIADHKYFEASQYCPTLSEQPERQSCYAKLAAARSAAGDHVDAAKYYAKAGLDSEALGAFCRAAESTCVKVSDIQDLRLVGDQAKACQERAAATCNEKGHFDQAGHYHARLGDKDRARELFRKAADKFLSEAKQAEREASELLTKPAEPAAPVTGQGLNAELENLVNQLQQFAPVAKMISLNKTAKSSYTAAAKYYDLVGDTEKAAECRRALAALEASSESAPTQAGTNPVNAK
jgi:hypothetical protein